MRCLPLAPLDCAAPARGSDSATRTQADRGGDHTALEHANYMTPPSSVAGGLPRARGRCLSASRPDLDSQQDQRLAFGWLSVHRPLAPVKSAPPDPQTGGLPRKSKREIRATASCASPPGLRPAWTWAAKLAQAATTLSLRL